MVGISCTEFGATRSRDVWIGSEVETLKLLWRSQRCDFYAVQPQTCEGRADERLGQGADGFSLRLANPFHKFFNWAT